MNKLPNESMQQYRGRQKEEINAANDALNLQIGEPVLVGNRTVRFHSLIIDKRKPIRITRLKGDALDEFLVKEKAHLLLLEERRQKMIEHEAFYARPDVADADAVRYIIEDRLKQVIDRLSPAEWNALRLKLEA